MRRTKQIKNTITTLGLFAAMLMAGRAEGTFIEFTFGGTVTGISGAPDPPWEGIGVGSAFSISYVFDSEAIDQQDASGDGVYEVLGLRVTVDGITDTAGFAKINILAFGGFNEYRVVFNELSFGGGGTILLNTFNFLPSDALLTNINLDDWLIARMNLSGYSGDTSVAAPISTFSSRIVPGPSTILIFSLSILITNFRRRTNT